MTYTKKTVIAIIIFSIAMAALEGAVVVYLRALYYPNEFTVAFKIIDQQILGVELVREFATLIMLGSIGYFAGRNFIERLAYFLLSFAIWDIFYYGWLKIFIDWPASFLEWDILFLIPFTWIGPVGAPLVCSLTMIALAAVLLHRGAALTFPKIVWIYLFAGTLVILFTFMKDYGSLIITNGFLSDYLNLMHNEDFITKASSYKPTAYSWSIFWTGEFLIAIGIINLLLNGENFNKYLSRAGQVDSNQL